LLYALFSFAIIVIVDLDRPRSGSIQVSQTALEEVVADLDRLRFSNVRRVEPETPTVP
jgi:hypothetical protein